MLSVERGQIGESQVHPFLLRTAQTFHLSLLFTTSIEVGESPLFRTVLCLAKYSVVVEEGIIEICGNQ